MKQNVTYCAFFFFVFLLSAAAKAATLADTADRPHRLFAAAAVRQGSLVAYKEDALKNRYTAFDLRLGWQTDSHDANPFDAMYRYPSYGVGFYVSNMSSIVLGTDTVSAGLGKPVALYGFFGAPIYRGKKWVVSYHLGLGLAYNFSSYHAEKNPFNLLVGSKANAHIELGIDASLLLPGRSALAVGISFQHFSNGSYQKPNLGANLISGTLAYRFSRFKNEEKRYAALTLPEWKKSWEWDVAVSGGVRMLDTDFDPALPRNGRRWRNITLSTALLRQASLHRRWGGGVDMLYYEWGSYVNSYRATLEELATGADLEESSAAPPTPAEVRQAMQPYGKLSAKNFTAGLYAAYELRYKRVSLIANLGVYPLPRVGDKPSNPIIYERLGVRVALTERLFAGVSIRAHAHRSEYTEWAVGYTLKRKESPQL